MQRIVVLCVAAVLAPTSALVCRDTSALTRRGLLKQTVAAAAPLLTLGATPVWANTQAELDKPMEKFDVNADKREAFIKKQKVYKKAWRKELSKLEFADNGPEAVEAIDKLIKLIAENGFEIPEGVRKMDLDQVYKNVKPKLDKDARMEFAKLDDMVRRIVTVKGMQDEMGLLGY